MTYGVGLITGAQIAELTGIQDLANLVTDNEITLDNFAKRASDAIYRRLEEAGIDPTLLTNESRLADAVAFEACERLALAGYIGGDASDFGAKVTQAFREFRPAYSSSADTARNATEGVPCVGHLDDDNAGTFFDDLPTLS